MNPAGAPGPAPTPLVSYVIRAVPKLSETFVMRELLALHAQGVPLEIWSLLAPDPREVAMVPQFAAIAPLVRTAPRGVRGALRMGGELAAVLARHPARGLRATGWALRWTIHDRDPRQAVALLFAAHLARHARGTHFHAHFANTPATTALLAGMLSTPARTASFTGHARDLWTATSRPFLADKIRRARFVAVGTDVTARFVAGVAGVAGDAPHVVLARHGVEFDGPPPSREAVEPGHVVAVGRLVEKKGFADLIDAVAAVAQHGVSVRLTIVGDGPLQGELRAHAEARDVTSLVTFAGPQSQAEITELLRRAAVFALPCVVDASGDSDTFPLAIVEAMRASVPVLTTTVGEMGIVLRDGVTARVVAPRAPELLGAALLALLRDPPAAETLAAAGRALAERDYDTASAVLPLIAAFSATG